MADVNLSPDSIKAKIKSMNAIEAVRFARSLPPEVRITVQSPSDNDRVFFQIWVGGETVCVFRYEQILDQLEEPWQSVYQEIDRQYQPVYQIDGRLHERLYEWHEKLQAEWEKAEKGTLFRKGKPRDVPEQYPDEYNRLCKGLFQKDGKDRESITDYYNKLVRKIVEMAIRREPPPKEFITEAQKNLSEWQLDLEIVAREFLPQDHQKESRGPRNGPYR